MKRYRATDAFQLPAIRLAFENRQNKKDKYLFDVSVDHRYSILYIDNLYEIGEGKEYPIHCRVKDIKIIQNTDFVCNRCTNSSEVILVIDASRHNESNVMEINVNNILDIHVYPYKYDLEENPKIVPERLSDGFFVNETTYPQRVDMSVPNDPLIGDKDYEEIMGDGNNE